MSRSVESGDSVISQCNVVHQVPKELLPAGIALLQQQHTLRGRARRRAILINLAKLGLVPGGVVLWGGKWVASHSVADAAAWNLPC